MRNWVRFAPPGEDAAFGTLEAGRVAEHRGDMFGAATATGRSWALAEVRLLAPCVPGKVVALWNNYHALAAKLEKSIPLHPLFLLKPGSSVIGSGAPIVRPPRYAGKIAFEGELGIVIGRRCANVGVDEADACIFGYTCVNDVTASELLNEDPNFVQWTRAKGFDTFCCVGPSIATGLDWRAARVRTLVDGALRQDYPVSDLVFSPQEQVSRISGDMTLYPGDIISVGTSLGVGSIKDGATVAVAIEGVGELSNRLGA